MRLLTENEAKLLTTILGAIEGGEVLTAQVSKTQIGDESTPTFLRLVVDGGPTATTFADGPVPGRFPVHQAGELVGELIVWTKGGRLSALEFAWITDTAPTQMPDCSELEIG